MKVYKDIDLAEFKPWGGAVDTIISLTESEMDAVQAHLELMETAEGLSETDINDFLWYEIDFIAELCGYEDWEALEKAHEEV